MTQPAFKPQRYTLEEYLELERHSDLRHEFLDGFIHAMSGSSRRHNDIVNNLTEALRPQARAKKCSYQSENIKLWVEAVRRMYYPDVVITCVESDNDPYVVYFPCFLLEVLSPSTDQTDRREKFEAYTRLTSLQTYVLVHQAQRLLEVYTRSGQGWMMATLSEGTLEVGCAGASVSLEQIYDRIELDG